MLNKEQITTTAEAMLKYALANANVENANWCVSIDEACERTGFSVDDVDASWESVCEAINGYECVAEAYEEEYGEISIGFYTDYIPRHWIAEDEVIIDHDYYSDLSEEEKAEDGTHDE